MLAVILISPVKESTKVNPVGLAVKVPPVMPDTVGFGSRCAWIPAEDRAGNFLIKAELVVRLDSH